MCSMVSSTVNTFDDIIVNLENKIKSNCSVLLVADCTISSRFAVFVESIESDDNLQSFELEVHVDDHVIWYSPRKDEKDYIRLWNSTEVEVTSLMWNWGDDVELG